MKKLFVFSVALTAILSLSSCNKETVDSATALPEGKVVSFTLDVPGEQNEAEEDVKLSFGEKVGDKIHMTWNAGDAFALITRLPDGEYTYNGDKKQVEPSATVADCGPFTTTQDGVSTATFSGTIPDGAPDQNGMAIFPASAYAAGTGHIQYSSNFLIGFNTALPSEQDGTGVKYLVATAKLKNGNLGKFTFPFGMVKINVPAGLGITKISLSEPVGTTKPLCANKVHLYYYFDKSGCSLATTADKVYSINVSNGGEELSGDIYFVTRNLDAGVTLTLSFFKGAQLSKPMKATSKALSGGQMIDYGTVTPVFPEQTVITYDRGVETKANRGFIPTGEEEKFPYAASSESPYQISIKSNKEDVITDFTWYNTEHTYTLGGYEWTFGSTMGFEAGYVLASNDGMYFYTGATNCNLRMQPKTYIKLPVVNGKKLVAISVSIANGKSVVWWKLAKDNAAANCLNGAGSVSMNSESGLVTVNLTDTEDDTPYYFVSTGGATQPVKLILYYQ